MTLPARGLVCGPIAPRREPSFLTSAPHSSSDSSPLPSPPLPSVTSSSQWQGSLSGPLPPPPTRLPSSFYRNRSWPDGIHPPGLPVARADRPNAVQRLARSSCRALITVRPPRSTRLPPGESTPCLSFSRSRRVRALPPSLHLSCGSWATADAPTLRAQVFVGFFAGDEHTPHTRVLWRATI